MSQFFMTTTKCKKYREQIASWYKIVNMEGLNLSEDDLFDLLDQNSTTKDSIPPKRQVPIEELEYWLKILFENLKGQLHNFKMSFWCLNFFQKTNEIISGFLL